MTIANTPPYTLTNGATADASEVMANFNQIVSNVNANAAANGANSDITSLTGLTTPLGRTYGGSQVFTAGLATGTANAQVVATLVPTGFALTTGVIVAFLAVGTNTGALTLNANGTGVKNVFRLTPSGAVACVGGEVVINQLVFAQYDGTQYQLLTNAAVAHGVETTLASATTTDLGTIASRVISITGTTTITSFGSSAIAGLPIYIGRFTGALTLTHNATSLILPGGANITTAAGDRFIAMYLGSGNWSVLMYQKTAPTYRLVSRQVFKGSDAVAPTWTRPSNVSAVNVRLQQAGSGGTASAASGGVSGTVAEGGPGGGYAEKWITNPGATEAVSVPIGGVGGSTAGTRGASPLASASFGAHITITATPQPAAVLADGTSTVMTNGTASNTPTGGDINVAGGRGDGYARLNGAYMKSGHGGDSVLGKGGRAGMFPAGTSQAGSAGSGFGGGGAGGISQGGAAFAAGGNGTEAICIVDEYTLVG